MKNIEYFEKDGELWFSYEETEGKRTYKSSGKISKRIQSKGEKAIIEHAERRVKKEIKKKKALFQKKDKIAKNPDFPVETDYKGETLKGKIISVENRTVRVRMEIPYQKERMVNYGFGCTKSVLELKNGKWVLTEDAISSAKRLLVEICIEGSHYEKNKKVIDLANKLNESSGAFEGIEVETFKKIT